MDLQQLSASYAVRRLAEADIPAVLALQSANPQFYRYHPPLPSEASIREDLSALPPGKTAADKGPGRIRVSFKTVQGSVSWDTCYTPCGMCPAFNYTSITYPC